MDIIGRLKQVKTTPELDALRRETFEAMESDGSDETFERVQGEFIKAKNRLRRIPLSQRDW
jgi:hypothetical protein